MIHDQVETHRILDDLLHEKLKPIVKKVDCEAHYAEDYLKSLGQAGLLQSQGLTENEVLLNGARLVEETAKTCMTTAFNLWCHLASLTYLRHSDNAFLRQEILPLLENGQKLGGTGLSNPMKYYSGLAKLHLSAERVPGGYAITGHLGAVSNLGAGHWFGIVAEVHEGQRMMALIPCDAEGLTLKAKADYLGLNGSATYACQFQQVFIADRYVITEDADAFVKKIRPAFIVYQIPLGFGVTHESVRAIEKVCKRQEPGNALLPVQSEELEAELVQLRNTFIQLIESGTLNSRWSELAQIRLDSAYLALKAVQAGMLHEGGSAYLRHSHASRRLREAYFFANLTPTIKHLELMLNHS